MHRLAYTETVQDAPGEMRAIEREAFGKAIDLLEGAQQAGARSHEAALALAYVRQLWSILIEDLASPSNGLPPLLRAQMISIGLSILRSAEDIRMERASDFAPMIEVSRVVLEGIT